MTDASAEAVSRPTVSVVIAAYNAERTIGSAISGALDQDHPEVEIVVVDDGSTDRTAAVCEGYGDLVRVIRQPNGGTAAARNAGIAAATGELITLCDADDILLTSHVSRAVEALRASTIPRSFVSSNALVVSATGVLHNRQGLRRDFPGPNRQRLQLLQSNVVSVFTTFPRLMWEAVGGFDPSCPIEDWDMWLRAVFSGWTVVPQHVPTALYRWGATSKSTDHERVFRAEDEVLAAVRSRSAATLTPQEVAFLDRRLASRSPRLLTYEGDLALREGDLDTARARYRSARKVLTDDRKLRLRASLAATRPGAHLFAKYLRRVDRATGRDPRVFR